MAEEKLWNVNEVAEFLGMKKQGIYQMIFYRRIPVIKLSTHCVRFDPQAIKKWLAEKTAEANPRRSVQYPGGGGGATAGDRARIDRIVDAARQEVEI